MSDKDVAKRVLVVAVSGGGAFLILSVPDTVTLFPALMDVRATTIARGQGDQEPDHEAYTHGLPMGMRFSTTCRGTGG